MHPVEMQHIDALKLRLSLEHEEIEHILEQCLPMHDDKRGAVFEEGKSTVVARILLLCQQLTARAKSSELLEFLLEGCAFEAGTGQGVVKHQHGCVVEFCATCAVAFCD